MRYDPLGKGKLILFFLFACSIPRTEFKKALSPPQPFRNHLIEGLNPLRVACCVEALKGEGERGNWARESARRARREKKGKEGERFPFSTFARAPEFLLLLPF